MSVMIAKSKAKEMGIKVANMKYNELVRTIQQKEGYSPCFQTGNNKCDQKQCLWRKDCVPN